jgi:trk system potassium uptake protein
MAHQRSNRRSTTKTEASAAGTTFVTLTTFATLWRNTPPAQLVALSFALVALLGGFLLSQPFALAPGQQLSFLDALFMATSAVCVTGLAVVDPGQTFSLAGEIILLLLMQIGGVGIITAATMLALGIGRRLSVAERLSTAETFGSAIGNARTLLRTIITTVLVVEFVGFLLLWWLWLPREGERAAYYALFHVVSAFNNAGFSLYPDNLIALKHDFASLAVLGTLIMFGGLGFTVVLNLLQSRRERDFYHITLTTRIIVITSGTLWLLGTALYCLFEWNNPQTLAVFDWWQRPIAAVFLAVTPRTAGFNTIDYSLVQHNTTLLTLALMFIGGSPTSTAGGIKNTTLYVLFISVFSFLRHGGDITTLGRRLEVAVILKAISVFFLASVIVGVAVMVLGITDGKYPLSVLVFEAISAFATVGLSMNLTASLSEPGRVVIIGLMYLGRVGLLTLSSALWQQRGSQRLRYPSEDVTLG